MKSKFKPNKKERISKYGEVFTPKNIVDEIINLIPNESSLIESRHLEPACGDGNFLLPILKRKLEIVSSKYKKNNRDYNIYSLLALSSIYGIEKLPLNVVSARKRLIEHYSIKYIDLFNVKIEKKLLNSIQTIVERNIINGDAISLTKIDKLDDIVFSEWSLVNKTYFKRRDFTFKQIIDYSPMDGLNLFSDLGENAFIPKPIKEYPLKHYLKISYVS